MRRQLLVLAMGASGLESARRQVENILRTIHDGAATFAPQDYL
jgi:hypothetical protein